MISKVYYCCLSLFLAFHIKRGIESSLKFQKPQNYLVERQATFRIEQIAVN